jgi:hypothetical protein
MLCKFRSYTDTLTRARAFTIAATTNHSGQHSAVLNTGAISWEGTVYWGHAVAQLFEELRHKVIAIFH